MLFTYSIFSLGDMALTIDFGNTIDETVNRKVIQLSNKIRELSPLVKDCIPAYSSITVYYDVPALFTKGKTAFQAAKELLLPLLELNDDGSKEPSRLINIPVCYAKKYAPDLAEMAQHKNLPVDALIRLHTSQKYRVYMIGFMPGFAYMGRVDERLAAPRRTSPRITVPAGAVGIAGEQTGIYPFTSPGGWNIIGQTPQIIFDLSKEPPGLLQPGDEVCFYSITEDEFENSKGRTS